MKIAGIGNALVDVLVHLNDDTLLQQAGLPRGGMQLIDDAKRQTLYRLMEPLCPRKSTGGSAGNTIKALAALGGDCVFIGKVGDDDDATLLADTFHRMHAETRLLRGDRHTGVASTLVSPTGERTFGTCLGAASTLKAEDITERLFVGLDWLHIEGYLVQDHGLIERIGQVAKCMGLTTSMDLASYNVLAEDVDFARHLVQDYVDVVFANEDESRVFTGGKEPHEALTEMAGMCDTAVVKLGADGSMVQHGAEVYAVQAIKAPQVTDTTGAGDFFAAGFLFARMHGVALKQCLDCGSVMGAEVVQVMGTDLRHEAWDACRDRVKEIMER